SRERAEPLLGTASRVQRWMVIEQPGSWGIDALRESRLDTTVADRLPADGAAHGVRILLARRPGQRALGDARRVFFAHSSPERWWIEQVDVDAGADDALTGFDLEVLTFPAPPGWGVPGPVPLHLVCTNGRHDPCCADHGRPVVRALVAGGAPDVWEVSHIGGDRFAANLVSLPRGIYYGRVPPDDAVRIAGDDRAGVVDLAHYRGRSCYPPLVQAAEWFARDHLGERRADGLRVLAVSVTGRGEQEVQLEQHGGPVLTVCVHRDRTETAQQLTCRSERMQRPWRYTLVDLRVAWD